MLTKWGLTNFKSIYNADLDLAPLTVFTGTNSSGKSSFIQSILMVAQTIRNPFSEDKENTLMLNGPLVKLGLLSSIKSFSPEEDGSETDHASLGIRWEYGTLTDFDVAMYYTGWGPIEPGWTKTSEGFIRWNPVKSDTLFGSNKKFGYCRVGDAYRGPRPGDYHQERTGSTFAFTMLNSVPGMYLTPRRYRLYFFTYFSLM
jgi:hypothetical protein